MAVFAKCRTIASRFCEISHILVFDDIFLLNNSKLYHNDLSRELDFVCRPSPDSEQWRRSFEATQKAFLADLEQYAADYCSWWNRLKTTFKYSILLYFPGGWCSTSMSWLQRWSNVLPEVELAGCFVC